VNASAGLTLLVASAILLLAGAELFTESASGAARRSRVNTITETVTPSPGPHTNKMLNDCCLRT
jgi:hypothetical protein